MPSRWIWTATGLALLVAALGVQCASAQPAPAQKAPTPGDGRELVAVLELDGVNTGKPEPAALTEELRAQLLQTGKFRVVDRQQIDAILKEQAFQQSGCTSQECAAQVGKILGVRKIIVGRVTRINDTLWQVAAQMVDAESAETVRAVTVNHDGTFIALLGTGMAALAGKLTGGAAVQVAASPYQGDDLKARLNRFKRDHPAREPVTGMEFVWVPGGEFTMGCGGSWAGECYDWEKPAHRVRLDGYWLAKTEVTQGQWQAVMGNNPSYFKSGDDYPVEQVSWEDAQEFVRRLNGRGGGGSVRLPTEAEWEYACRAGGREQAYGTASGSLSTAANVDSNGTEPVASYAPNALGLADMTGNVWEWVEDTYSTYGSNPSDNPVSHSGAYRVIRGGGWDSHARFARCSIRFGNQSPSNRNDHLGFRLARNP